MLPSDSDTIQFKSEDSAKTFSPGSPAPQPPSIFRGTLSKSMSLSRLSHL